MKPRPTTPDRSELLEVHGFTGGPFAENAYLVRCTRSDRVVVVDPGAVAPEIVTTLGETGWELQAIYLTHAHLDHIEGIPTIRAFSDVPIFLHPADQPLYDRTEQMAAYLGVPNAEPLPSPDEPLIPGTPVPVGEQELDVRFTPGHAPGHVILHSAPAGFALVGDVIFQASIGRTDLPGGDLQQLMASIREQVLTLPDETRLLPGHGAETTVRRERLGNPFLTSQAPGQLA